MKWVRILAAVLAVLLLSACGGGTPVPPVSETEQESVAVQTQTVPETSEVPEAVEQETHCGYARNQPIESDDFLRLEINDVSVIGLDEGAGQTVVMRVGDVYFPYLAKKEETRFFLQKLDGDDEEPVQVTWDEFLSRMEGQPGGEMLVAYETEPITELGYPVITRISQVLLPSNENAMSLEDLVGRWSLQWYEVDGYVEDTSEYGLENSFTFVRSGDGSITASHIEEYPYGGMTEITDAPVEYVETDDDYLLFRQYEIPWYGELDLTGQPMSDMTIVWERYCVGLMDANTLLVHYTAETTAEPYLIGIVYCYARVNPTGD